MGPKGKEEEVREVEEVEEGGGAGGGGAGRQRRRSSRGEKEEEGQSASAEKETGMIFLIWEPYIARVVSGSFAYISLHLPLLLSQRVCRARTRRTFVPWSQGTSASEPSYLRRARPGRRCPCICGIPC